MISIIIPTLNEESVIAKTIKSLRELSVVDFEIIISDGGSKDKTIEIAKELADKVIVHSSDERQTIGGGKNAGAKEASGKYLLFIDADVTISNINESIKKIIEEFDGNDNLLAATMRLLVTEETRTIADKVFSAIAINWPHYLNNNILGTGSSSGEFQFIRKELFLSLGGYNETLALGEDVELFWRIAKKGKTKMFYDLIAYHSGRRFHKVGWPKIIWQWTTNLIYMGLFKKSNAKVWKPIR